MIMRGFSRHTTGTAVASSTVALALLVASLSDKSPEPRQTGAGLPATTPDCPPPGAEGCEEETGQETPEETRQKGKPSSSPSSGKPPGSGSRPGNGRPPASGGRGSGNSGSGGGKSWAHPISGRAMSAAFGNAGGRWARGHTGVDFPAPVGTPVSAAGGGTVVKAGSRGAGDGAAYGNAVVIKHASGTYSQYAHLLRVEVRVGDTVRAGQRIALSGNTGNTSGPHLHFEIRTSPNYGNVIDPVHFLRSRGVSL